MKQSNRRSITTILVFCCLLALAAAKIKFTFKTGQEGFFLFSGDKGYWLEISDDVRPEELDRLLWALRTTIFKKVIHAPVCTDSSQSCLTFEWNKPAGNGYIKNIFPDGRKLLINLSRFEENGAYPEGIFIGGGLPPSDPDYTSYNRNETGMAYFDGLRWHHVWCNANEGLENVDSPFTSLPPIRWKYLGSQVLQNDSQSVTITSKHRVMLDGTPLELRRFLHYQAGDSYISLLTTVTNAGNTTARFIYSYGDEPWIGNYGTSIGNIGWYRDGLILHERSVDPVRYSSIGMFDYGNELAGEPHTFTGTANFIEWGAGSHPNKVYISNGEEVIENAPNPAPLSSPGNRILDLIWGPISLAPRQSFSFEIAVGMAANDPVSGMPVKPKTHLSP
ncbi:MAG: hypothetical protein WA003_16180 [Desulfuromonadaceae bacterium]